MPLTVQNTVGSINRLKMKKLLFIFILFNLLLTSCVNKSKYNKNLKTCEDLVTNINSFFNDSLTCNSLIIKYLTDDFTFHYFPAGNRKGIKLSKQEFLDIFFDMKKKFVFNIAHTIFLPGLNELTHKIDGSVRVYYGADIFYKKDTIEFSAYQTINFDNQKISEVWEWADYGGISNLLENESY